MTQELVKEDNQSSYMKQTDSERSDNNSLKGDSPTLTSNQNQKDFTLRSFLAFFWALLSSSVSRTASTCCLTRLSRPSTLVT